MNKLLVTLLLALSLKADTIVIAKEEISEMGNPFYILTVCKDGYEHTVVQNQAKQIVSMYQNFMWSNNQGNTPIKCQMDFKHPSQFAK